MLAFRYSKWDEDLLQALRQLKDLVNLFNFLLVKTDGDVERALQYLRYLQKIGMLDPNIDLGQFVEELKEERLVKEDPVTGQLTLAPKGEQSIRRSALEAIFDNLKRGPAGNHPTPHEGTVGDPLPETRPFEFGDDLRNIDFPSSFKNALRRGHLELQEDDLEVRQSEHHTSCATALLLDISHSMVLYGEDRITPAKQVALALTELIMTRYQKDKLSIIVFGNDAQEVPLSELPYVSVGPYHTNTKAALGLARQLLLRQKSLNRQIFMITDGKPSVIREPDGGIYRNSFGLDPRIVNQTLEEALLCRRHRIPITTFMIARDPYLQQFVLRLTELNKGRAYFASLDHLGDYVFMDFIRHRRRRMR